MVQTQPSNGRADADILKLGYDWYTREPLRTLSIHKLLPHLLNLSEKNAASFTITGKDPAGPLVCLFDQKKYGGNVLCLYVTLFSLPPSSSSSLPPLPFLHVQVQ